MQSSPTSNSRNSRAKVAFIIHRYGPDLGGGIERHCQLVAEHMTKHWNIEILTTCARDFSTWKNEYPPGPDHLNGIPIHRFPVDHERDPISFARLTDKILDNPSDLESWMVAQGPYSTALLDYLRHNAPKYDACFFFSYLYATTYFGIQLVSEKSILIPAAHDEPMIRLPIYQTVFEGAQYILFNTLEEKKLIERVCSHPLPGEITGVNCGPLPVKDFNNTEPDRYLLYIGRIDHPKGCGELLGYFVPFFGGVKLYLVGQQLIEVPDNPKIRVFGYLTEEKKNRLLKNAVALVMPSPYESLSLVLLESWTLGVPVLVNAQCEALKGQCIRSGGGLMYEDTATFAEAATTLCSSPALRSTLGLRGQRYVRETYSWSNIEEKYLFALSALRPPKLGGGGLFAGQDP